MGYIIIKHMDTTGDGDYKVIETERLEVEDGEHIFHPKEIEGYENMPEPEPPTRRPDPCDKEWEPPHKEPIPFGSQRIAIGNTNRIGYVEFCYKEVVL